MTLDAFVTVDQLASSLGIAAPTDELILGRWTDALADASAYLRTVIGQPITAGTATLTVWTDSAGVARIWLVPVTGITSITDHRGNTVGEDDWTLKDQELYLRAAGSLYTVELAYGYTEIPAEIARWTKILAATQINVSGEGNLGMSNVTAVAVDDGRVQYTGAMSVALPDMTAQWLKATFGGPQ